MKGFQVVKKVRANDLLPVLKMELLGGSKSYSTKNPFFYQKY
jgi:hypothetical protein